MAIGPLRLFVKSPGRDERVYEAAGAEVVVGRDPRGEIPVEDKLVHTRFDPWKNWEFSLERSPIFHAEKSRTALLIAHGEDDSRVHPSQSLQLYRALKLIDKTPVRYIRYPGEGHGNRKAAARDDYARRLMRWMNHFVRDKGTGLPEWELDIDLGEDDDAAEDES